MFTTKRENDRLEDDLRAIGKSYAKTDSDIFDRIRGHERQAELYRELSEDMVQQGRAPHRMIDEAIRDAEKHKRELLLELRAAQDKMKASVGPAPKTRMGSIKRFFTNLLPSRGDLTASGDQSARGRLRTLGRAASGLDYDSPRDARMIKPGGYVLRGLSKIPLPGMGKLANYALKDTGPAFSRRKLRMAGAAAAGAGAGKWIGGESTGGVIGAGVGLGVQGARELATISRRYRELIARNQRYIDEARALKVGKSFDKGATIYLRRGIKWLKDVAEEDNADHAALKRRWNVEMRRRNQLRRRAGPMLKLKYPAQDASGFWGGGWGENHQKVVRELARENDELERRLRDIGKSWGERFMKSDVAATNAEVENMIRGLEERRGRAVQAGDKRMAADLRRRINDAKRYQRAILSDTAKYGEFLDEAARTGGGRKWAADQEKQARSKAAKVYDSSLQSGADEATAAKRSNQVMSDEMRFANARAQAVDRYMRNKANVMRLGAGAGAVAGGVKGWKLSAGQPWWVRAAAAAGGALVGAGLGAGAGKVGHDLMAHDPRNDGDTNARKRRVIEVDRDERMRIAAASKPQRVALARRSKAEEVAEAAGRAAEWLFGGTRRRIAGPLTRTLRAKLPPPKRAAKPRAGVRSDRQLVEAGRRASNPFKRDPQGAVMRRARRQDALRRRQPEGVYGIVGSPSLVQLGRPVRGRRQLPSAPGRKPPKPRQPPAGQTVNPDKRAAAERQIDDLMRDSVPSNDYRGKIDYDRWKPEWLNKLRDPRLTNAEYQRVIGEINRTYKLKGADIIKAASWLARIGRRVSWGASDETVEAGERALARRRRGRLEVRRGGRAALQARGGQPQGACDAPGGHVRPADGWSGCEGGSQAGRAWRCGRLDFRCVSRAFDDRAHGEGAHRHGEAQVRVGDPGRARRRVQGEPAEWGDQPVRRGGRRQGRRDDHRARAHSGLHGGLRRAEGGGRGDVQAAPAEAAGSPAGRPHERADAAHAERGAVQADGERSRTRSGGC